ncbi:MAG: hypothetical protein R3F42_01330 [Pseudomonadota bacterium]
MRPNTAILLILLLPAFAPTAAGGGLHLELLQCWRAALTGGVPCRTDGRAPAAAGTALTTGQAISTGAAAGARRTVVYPGGTGFTVGEDPGSQRQYRQGDVIRYYSVLDNGGGVETGTESDAYPLLSGSASVLPLNDLARGVGGVPAGRDERSRDAATAHPRWPAAAGLEAWRRGGNRPSRP